MPPKLPRPRAADFVRQAAFLKREFEGRNESVRFLSDNSRRIIYVFDTDVIITKCAPWITGPVGEKGDNGYGAIFTDEGEDRADSDGGEPATTKAEIIASILADHILTTHRKANNNAPIFQFPSHARETNIVYRAVRRTVETFDRADFRGPQSRRAFELSRAIALLRYRASQGAKKEDVTVTIDRIVDWLMYSDHTNSRRARALREWDAYYSLETEYGGIYSLEKAAAFFLDEPELSQALLVMQPSNRRPDEERMFHALVHHWSGTLDKRDRHNIEADAHALAYLFLVNARLSNTPWRCVFVTGDRALAKAAYARVPAVLVPDELKTYADEFSLRCVRHLWAYSSDALIEPGKEENFVDLFSGLLGLWSGHLRFSARALEDLSSRQDPGSTFIPEDNLGRALSEWDTLTSKAIASHSFAEFQKEEGLRLAVWNVIERSAGATGWSNLESDLHEEVARVRDRTILSMSDLGIDVIIQAEKLGKRNPPELFFESLTNTNEIFRKLSVVNGYTDASSFEVDLKKIKLDCHDSSKDGDDRQESHLKFLALGAAFASAERWLIAFSHAERAISIIDRSRKTKSRIRVRHDGSRGAGPKSHMSGREAYFLAAVAQRILAARPSHFDRATSFLNRAVEALNEDWSNDTAFHITPARFDNEKLAIALSRYYLTRSEDPSDYHSALIDGVYQAAGKVLELFADWRSGSNSSALRNITIVNLATNIIQTFVISQFRSHLNLESVGTGPIPNRSVADAVAAIKQLTGYESKEGVDKINATRLIRAYTLVGEMFTTNSSSEVRGLVQRLQELLGNGDDVVVTRYDRWRYQALMDFVVRMFSA